MAEAKTTWERLRARLGPLGERNYGCGLVTIDGWAIALEQVCDELDAKERRIAELERNLAEMARGER